MFFHNKKNILIFLLLKLHFYKLIQNQQCNVINLNTFENDLNKRNNNTIYDYKMDIKARNCKDSISNTLLVEKIETVLVNNNTITAILSRKH